MEFLHAGLLGLVDGQYLLGYNTENLRLSPSKGRILGESM